MDIKAILKRYGLPVVLILFAIHFGKSAIENAEFTSWERENLDEIEEQEETFLSSYNPYTPQDAFLGYDGLIDEGGIISNQDMKDITGTMESIYNSAGVQVVFYVVSPEEGDEIASREVMDFSNGIYDELAANTSDAGENLYLVTFILRDNAVSEYDVVAGDTAKDLVDLVDSIDDVYWSFDYAIECFDDEDEDYGTHQELFAKQLYYGLNGMSLICEDPEGYFEDDLYWTKEGFKEDLYQAIFMFVLTAGFAGGAIYTLSKPLALEKKTNKHDLWNNELAEFSNFSTTSGFDDIDSATNPYHDLVAKYGGFDKEDVQKEVKEEN